MLRPIHYIVGMAASKQFKTLSQPLSTLPEPLDALQGSLADVDIEGLMRREQQDELIKDRLRPHTSAQLPEKLAEVLSRSKERCGSG